MLHSPKRKINHKVEMANVLDIKPSPENDSIYGAIDPKDLDLINLANDIAENGIREPIQVSSDGFIISGHRRYAASRLVGLQRVPVVRKDIKRREHSATAWKRILRAHNHQRVKPAHVRLKETLLDVDPDIAHRQLIQDRELRDRNAPPPLRISGEKVRATISDRKQEMLNACIGIVEQMKKFWPLSDRGIHYGLLNNPPMRNTSTGRQRAIYANDAKSYGDLCDLLTRARLDGLIPWEAIADETRPVSHLRFNKDVSQFVDLEMHNFLRGYRRDLLQSQPDHIELIVEKLTVKGILGPVAAKYTMPMTVGRGHCSITPRYEIVERFKRSGKDRLILLVASDFDPDGECIAESFVRSIRDDFGVDDVRASKIFLRQDQVKKWDLPPNGMEAKKTSSSYQKFYAKYRSNDVYELEAMDPWKMQEAATEAIEGTIDLARFKEELASEKAEAARLKAMKIVATEAFSDMSGNGGEA